MSDTSGAKPLPTPDTHPLIFRLARHLGMPLSFYDIETTGLGLSQPTFGITEFAFLAVMPDGRAHPHSKILDPQNKIEQRASEITGITQAMVDGQPTFADHADKIHRMFSKSVAVGFNIAKFDTPAVMGQFARYGIEAPAGFRSVDLYSVWKDVQGTSKGKQVEVAEHYGVPFAGAHRALADCSALADILEQMIWRHGIDSFSRAIAIGLNGPEAAASGAPRPARAPRAANGELTASQSALKAAIDEATGRQASVQEFCDALAAQGFAVEVTKFGGSRYFRARGTPQEEKLNGSDLGKGYGWKDVSSKLTGETPASIVEAGGYAATGKTPEDKASKGAEEARSRAAVLAQAGEPSIDVARAVAESGSSAKSVSFAISNLLVDGALRPDQVTVASAQAWLDAHWASLPAEGKLTPLLNACVAAGCPKEVDFLQLRVAKATRGMGSPAPSKPAARPAGAAPAPQAAPAPSAPSEPPSFAEIPPFDDELPPFDEAPPNASRHAP